jgi:hypothetical protein
MKDVTLASRSGGGPWAAFGSDPSTRQLGSAAGTHVWVRITFWTDGLQAYFAHDFQRADLRGIFDGEFPRDTRFWR